MPSYEWPRDDQLKAIYPSKIPNGNGSTFDIWGFPNPNPDKLTNGDFFDSALRFLRKLLNFRQNKKFVKKTSSLFRSKETCLLQFSPKNRCSLAPPKCRASPLVHDEKKHSHFSTFEFGIRSGLRSRVLLGATITDG